MEKKFPVLDKIHEIQVGNKITPTISVGIACDGRSLEEVSLNAAKALDLALGRGGDQVVVAIGGSLQFFLTVLWRHYNRYGQKHARACPHCGAYRA